MSSVRMKMMFGFASTASTNGTNPNRSVADTTEKKKLRITAFEKRAFMLTIESPSSPLVNRKSQIVNGSVSLCGRTRQRKQRFHHMHLIKRFHHELWNGL